MTTKQIPYRIVVTGNAMGSIDTDYVVTQIRQTCKGSHAEIEVTDMTPPKAPRARKAPTGKSARWQAAAAELRSKFDVLQAAIENFNEAREELKSVQEEYQEWYDNMPESLQQGATGEKLSAIGDIDLETEAECSDLETMVDEAENADLPAGFGRD